MNNSSGMDSLATDAINQHPVLQSINLTKSFQLGSETIEVLKGIDFTLDRGETVAVLGTSGAGKTTLLTLLGGLERPDSGEVFVERKSLTNLSDRHLANIRNSRLGFVYQLHHLLGEFTALENVQMPLLIAGTFSPQETKERAASMLNKVGLDARLAHKPAELSGGERQRVAIARALVANPACMLLDEPTGNLDRTNASKVMDLLLHLASEQKTAMVLVTHDAELAARLERRVEMYDGLLKEM